MPTLLEIAEFNLEVLKARGKIEADLLKAYADFNESIAELLVKRAEAARSAEELAQLKAAHREYRAALAEAKKTHRKAERLHARYETAVRDTERLAWGEWLDPDLVGRSWAGFRFLLGQLTGAARTEVFGLTIEDQHRLGQHFSRNRYPNSQCEDAPGSIRNAVSLFEWAKRKNYLPRVGTPPQEQLFLVLDIIQEDAEVELQQLTAELADMRETLMHLRMADWTALDIGGLTRKAPKKK